MDFNEYYLNQNLIFAQRFVPDLKERLEKVNISSEFKIEGAQTGVPILVRNGERMNNWVNPIAECITVFESVPQNKDNYYILYGLELGHLLNFFNDNTKGHIIMYEPDLEVLKYTLSRVSFIKILADPKVLFVTTKEELCRAVEHTKTIDKIDKMYVLANRYYSNKYANEIAVLKEYYC